MSALLCILQLEEMVEHIEYVLRFFHASFAHQVACKFAISCLNNVVAVLAERLQVGLCSGVTVHIEIHGRGDEYGGFH